MKIAVLFPGQGVQKVGMGQDFLEAYPEMKEILNEASDVLGRDMASLIMNGPEEDLNRTDNTQPAIITVTYGMMEIFRKRCGDIHCMAGLSLGEYSALLNSGSISFKKVLPLVEKRGIFMLDAVPQGTGMMAAILGDKVEDILKVTETIRESGEYVAAVNFNSLKQTVVSGTVKGVEKAMEALKALGLKAIPLNVQAPFHTPLLSQAAADLGAYLERVPVNTPQIPVYFNTTGETCEDPEKIKALLKEQVISPVQWVKTMVNMLAEGVDTFIEVGPGKTLAGFLKGYPGDYRVFTVNSVESMEKTLKELEG